MRAGSSGAPLQVSRFQDLFKTVGTAVFVVWFIAEQQLQVPGLYAAIRLLPVSLPVALATANLIFNGSMALAAALLAGPIERGLLRLFPSDLVEDLGTPAYAVPEAIADAATATDLLEKEQMRMLKGTREYLTLARATGGTSDRTDATGLHRGFGRLFRDIEHFHAALVGKQIDERTSAWIGTVHGRQKVLELLEDSLHQLATSLNQRWRGGALEPVIENVIETLDFLLLFACDAATSLDYERANVLFNLSGDRGEMMVGVRNLYLASDRSLTAADRALLLRLTALFERIVWMVQRYAELLLRNIDAQTDAKPVAAQQD
jgi:phosphate:Na+ symporter